MLPLGAISAGISLAGQVFGAIKGAKANKANQKLLNQEKAENKSFYDNNANKDFLGTNVAKDAVKQQTQALEDNRKAVAGRGAITGASDEALVAGNTAANKTFQDGLSALAGKATEYQNHQEAIYRGQNANLNQQQRAINSAKADSAGNLTENAGSLLGAVAGQGMLGDKKPKAKEQDTSIFTD